MKLEVILKEMAGKTKEELEIVVKGIDLLPEDYAEEVGLLVIQNLVRTIIKRKN